MKKALKRFFQKKLEYLVWIWIIVLFFMIWHGKVAEARTIHEQGEDSTPVALVQDTGDQSVWSYINGKDKSHNEVFAYLELSEENGQEGVPFRKKLVVTKSSQVPLKDIYEEDNQPWQAWPIVVNNPAQLHTFHTDTDIDWVHFFGHAGYRYDMNADDGTPCDRFITLSLADPNGKILISEAGFPITSPYCSLNWKCLKDGYYCLKIEPPSEYPADGISYELSIEDDQAALPASILGRVVNSKQEGINGLGVNLVSSGQIIRNSYTGSLQNLRGITLEQSKINGWYFIPCIPSGTYDIILTGDDPNIILKQISDIHLGSFELKRIEDITFDFPAREADVVSKFDLVHTHYQNEKGEDYPVWEDNDNDGANNLDEILYGTDPDDPHNRPWDIELPRGWSMISIPLVSENDSISKLFRGVEVVYAYEKGAGYQRIKETEELKVGKGYWVLMNETKNYTLTGQPIDFYTLSLNEDGWEMIGGCTYAARPKTGNCNIGVIYEFIKETGYKRVPDSEDLKPGKGYWILLNGIEDQCELTFETN